MTISQGQADSYIRQWYAEALMAVDPSRAVQRYLQRSEQTIRVGDWSVTVDGSLVVVAVGKAASAMAAGANQALGDLIDEGFVLTKDGHAVADGLGDFALWEAGHPIPDARGERATRQILERMERCTSRDLVVALISGGASALFEASIDGVTLDEIGATTNLLLRAGAPIEDLNAVRTVLSRVKGGGLRRSASEARFVTMLLSDVLGNDPTIIASGPTVRPRTEWSDAIRVVERYRLLDRVPSSVQQALKRNVEPSSSSLRDTDESAFANDGLVVVADNTMAVESLADSANRAGLARTIAWTGATGEARRLAERWVKLCADAEADTSVILGGGEAAVEVVGDGIGGRNTEFAFVAAMELHRQGLREWTIASLATDGQDGPTEVAGAIVDAKSASSMREAGFDLEECLGQNNTLPPLEAIGAVVAPGPTGTNVNDLYLAIRTSPE